MKSVYVESFYSLLAFEKCGEIPCVLKILSRITEWLIVIECNNVIIVIWKPFEFHSKHYTLLWVFSAYLINLQKHALILAAGRKSGWLRAAHVK